MPTQVLDLSQFSRAPFVNVRTGTLTREGQAAMAVLQTRTGGVLSGGFQPLDSDLTVIAALAPADDDIIQRKAGAWVNRTPAQYKVDLALTKADVGLANVDNTSDLNKPISTATAAALALKVPTSRTINGYALSADVTLTYTDVGAQPADATLTALAGANWAANSLAIGSGADTVAQVTFAANTFPARASTGNLVAKTITDFGLSLVDDADAAAARTTMGLGTLATQNGTFSGTSSGTNTGDQTISITGDVTAAGSTGALAATVTKINGVSLAGLATGILKNTTTTGVPSIATAGTDYYAPGSTDVAVADGGTGASTASGARTNLGATTVGANVFTLTNPSAITWMRVNADNTVTARTASETRTDLGLVIGTNVQAWDTDLDSWAGVARASGFDTFAATPSSANLRALMTDESGTGALLFAGGALGTPASGTLTNCTGLPISTGVSGLGTNVATFLATPSSANLAAALTDETGTAGTVPFASSGTYTPVLTFATPGTLVVAYSAQSGTYIKIGNLVICWFNILTSTFTLGTASGNLQITGLPFTANATMLFTGEVQWRGITKASYTDMQVALANSDNKLTITACGSGQAATTITATDTPTGGPVLLRGVIVFST